MKKIKTNLSHLKSMVFCVWMIICTWNLGIFSEVHGRFHVLKSSLWFYYFFNSYQILWCMMFGNSLKFICYIFYWVLYYLLGNIIPNKTFPVLKNSCVFRKDWNPGGLFNYSSLIISQKLILVFCLYAWGLFSYSSVHSIIIILEVKNSHLKFRFRD